MPWNGERVASAENKGAPSRPINPCRRPCFEPVGETPTGATETVALPIFNGLVPPYFPALQPPSIRNAVPVTKADSSLARYNAAAAISSGRAMRPSACVEAISS